MIVKLTYDEFEICKTIGEKRSLIARAANVKDQKIGNQNGVEADIQGMVGEYAFAKQFNVFPDFGLSPRSGGYDGICEGLRYDIKSTKYKNGRLLCTRKYNKDVDVYVLAIVNLLEVNLVGFAYSSQLINPDNLINLGHGFGYALDQYELIKF
jgi:hypothetical protein